MTGRCCRSLVLSLAALAVLAACAGQQAPVTPPVSSKASASAKPVASASERPRPVPTLNPLSETVRPVLAGVPTQLTGKVKLISDWGVGLVSNNGGSVVSDTTGRVVSNNGGAIISNNGGAIISNNGGAVVANNGGALVGKTKFWRLKQADAADSSPVAIPEDLLADAQVEVLDAEGHVLVDEKGAPLVAFTDASGNYRLEAHLPSENLLLRVRLFAGGELAGGQLVAMVANGAGGAHETALDTTSSLAAAYVLQTYVKGTQTVFNRLPEVENQDLRKQIDLARWRLPVAKPVYEAAQLTAAVEGLRKLETGLDATLQRIEALLLAGQSNNGEGRLATEIPLSLPLGIAQDATGTLYVGESVAGRIRRIAPDGRASIMAGGATKPDLRDADSALAALFSNVSDLAIAPNGDLLVAEADAHQVRRIDAQGRVVVVAGTGVVGQDVVGGNATTTAICRPCCLTALSDGTVLIGENTSGAFSRGRILAVKPDQSLAEIALPGEITAGPITGLAQGLDGRLYMLNGSGGVVYARAADGTWSRLAGGFNTHDASRLAPAPDGGVYLAETRGHRVLHISETGQVKTLAGTGAPGYAGDGGPPAQALLLRPAGLTSLADGRLAVVESGNMVVRAFDPHDPAKPITTIVGTQGMVQQGDATAYAVNSPAGLAIDAQDRVVVAELGGSTLKRIAQGTLQLLAGSTTGYRDGPALSAAFNTPGALAYAPDGALWIMEAASPYLRRLTPDESTVETRAGTGKVGANARSVTSRQVVVGDLDLGRPLGLAIAPDGRPYWSDNAFDAIFRLNPGGQVEVVAGAVPAQFDKGGGFQDGQAADARFLRPSGLAFDKAGDLYVADTGNMCVRKVTGLGGETPMVTTVAGVPGLAALSALSKATVQQPDGTPANAALLIGPISLAFDAGGRLYVGEVGIARLTALGLPLLGAVPVLTPARVRRLDFGGATPTVATVVGPGSRVLADPLGDQSLGLPLGLSFDRAGRLVIADSLNNQIKVVPKAAL